MIPIVQFERLIQPDPYGLDAFHLADGDLNDRIRREDLIECSNVVAVEMVRIERSEVADFFAIEQPFEIDVQGK